MAERFALDVERPFLDGGPMRHRECRVSPAEIDALMASGRYRESSGSPYAATHYRRSLPDGSCLHLVIEGGRGHLHRDASDPHAGLASFAMHLSNEARSELWGACAIAWSLLRLLAR